ncbi:hypothetical protein AHAS_Ahas17G0266300 [Arachis hypogaea]
MATHGQGRVRSRESRNEQPADNHAEFMAAMENLANTMEANAIATLQAVQRLGQPAGNGNGDGNGHDNVEGNDDNMGGAPMTLATFLKVHPPSFRSSTNPTEADNWFQTMEQIPWDVFQTSFYKKYFPESAREAKEMELMQLKQGSLSVVDYTSRFEELCKFSRACQGAPETYESWKCIKYQRVLKDNIMTAIAPLEIRTFSDLMNKARVVEEYAKTVASLRDTHRGITNRGRDDYLDQGDRTLRGMNTLLSIFVVKGISEETTMLSSTWQREMVDAILADCQGTLLRIVVEGGTETWVGVSNQVVISV